MAYRVGIVGSGYGGVVHVPAFQKHPAFELVAIASPNRASSVAAQYGVPKCFLSLRDMLDGTKLDVVSIATPPYDHSASAMLAMSRGKHVFCEKPFTISVEAGEEMLAAAREAGVVNVIGYEFRYTASRIALKKLFDRGDLGKLRQIEITDLSGYRRVEVERPFGWWFTKESGGGLGQALLPHLIDNANWFAGRPAKKVTGVTRTAVRERRYSGKTFSSDVPDGVFVLIDYGDGLVARLTCDATITHASHLFAIHGENMSAVASGPHITETTVVTTDGTDTWTLDIPPLPYATAAAVHLNLPPFLALLDDFAAALGGKQNTVPTFADALASQRVLEQIGYGDYRTS